MPATCYPPTIPVRAAAPTFEPIELDEAKRQCGVPLESHHDDAKLLALIKAVRAKVEKDALLVFCTGSYTMKRTEWASGDFFELPSSLWPVTAVTAITYVDSAGTTQTMSAAEYALNTYSLTPMVHLNYGYSWPTLRGDMNGITITATAGYASAATIPPDAVNVVKMLVNHWYENPSAAELPAAYDSLIEGLRREAYA